MSKGTVRLDLQDTVAYLTIANETKLNAMSMEMWEALAAHVEALDVRDDVRAIVLRGEGGRAFVSGADISEFTALRSSADAVHAYDAIVERAQAALEQCRHPVIAAIQGFCLGGGIGLALSCDLRYAARGSRFRMPAARLGLGYGFRGMHRAVALLGSANATEMFFTARDYDGTEAARIGLVHGCVDDEDFERAIETLVARVASNAPLTLRAAKLAIRQATALQPSSVALAEMARSVQTCFASRDYAEGQRAFAEKRSPVFRGA